MGREGSRLAHPRLGAILLLLRQFRLARDLGET
jgi:hypothetical protein